MLVSDKQLIVITLGEHVFDAKNNLGGHLQNFLGKFGRFFVTLRCFYGVVIHIK